jgi:heterodisulfide reductase subunit C
MINFGYGINKDRQIVFDENDRSVFYQLQEIEPSIDICIQCGTCSSTCTTGQFTQFSFRQILLLVHRGEMSEIKSDIQKCMFCGKCQLACPRGVNTRNAIQSLYSILN